MIYALLKRSVLTLLADTRSHEGVVQAEAQPTKAAIFDFVYCIRATGALILGLACISHSWNSQRRFPEQEDDATGSREVEQRDTRQQKRAYPACVDQLMHR